MHSLRTSMILWTVGVVIISVVAAHAVTIDFLVSPGAYPCWSRDGTDRICYYSAGDIWVIPAAGGTPTEMTCLSWGSNMADPCWSPDGNTLAFLANVPTGILMFPAVACGDTDAVYVGHEYYFIKGMRWSPTGDRFVMRYGSDADPGIWVCPATEDGWDSRQRIVDMDDAQPQEPCWSPDGQWVAFEAYPYPGGPSQIFVVDSYGAGVPQAVTNESESCKMPDWSADGSWICFVKQWWYENYELAAVCLATGEVITLIPTGTFSGIKNPVLSEDGTSVVFQGVVGQWGLYVASDLEWPCPSSVRETSWGAIKALYRRSAVPN